MIKNIITHWRYLGFDKTEYESQKEVIIYENLNVLRKISFFAFFIGILAAIFLNYMDIHKMFVYGACIQASISFCVHFISALFTIKMKNVSLSTINTLLFFYIYATALLFIVLGTKYLFNDSAVIIIWFFGFLQVIFYLGPVKNLLVVSSIYIVFLICSYYSKDIKLFSFDVLNSTVAVSLGLLASWYKTRTKIHECVLKEKYRLDSITDSLTKLPNRFEIMEISKRLQKESIKKKKPFTCMVIDLDQFKLYNDYYGHPKGDLLLQKVSEIFIEFSKKHQIHIGRIGGEEFLVVFNNNLINENAIAEELRKSIASLEIPHINSTHKIATISIGLYKTLDNININRDTSYIFADKALYKAKKGERNIVYKYDDKIKRYIKIPKT